MKCYPSKVNHIIEEDLFKMDRESASSSRVLCFKELCRVKLIAKLLVDRVSSEGDALDRVYKRFEASDTATAKK